MIKGVKRAFLAEEERSGREAGTRIVDAGLTLIRQCAAKKRGSSAGESPTRQMLPQSEAIGAGMLATTCPKPPVQRVARRLGEYAGRNVQ